MKEASAHANRRESIDRWCPRERRSAIHATCGRFIIRPRTVTHALGFREDDARQLLRKFEIEGLVTPTDEYWQATAKGHALAMATAAPPLKRQTAERLLAEVVVRARAINSDSRWAYRVASLVVFGSGVG